MTFFRKLNPFATIRALRAENATLNLALANYRDANRFLIGQRDFIDAELDRHQAALSFFVDYAGAHEQAVAEFMEERETFKDRLVLAAAIVDVIDSDNDVAQEANEQLEGLVNVAENQAAAQAAETLEVISYVKVVEAKLAAAGIEIIDGPNGPDVVVDEAAFVGAVATSLNLGNGQRILQAA